MAYNPTLPKHVSMNGGDPFQQHLQSLLSKLKIPPDFGRFSDLVDHEVISYLNRWKIDVEPALLELEQLVKRNPENISLKLQGDISFASVPFTADEPWVTPTSKKAAQSILETLPAPTTATLRQILSENVKPVFRLNPHPSINLETGRRLARPAGGPMASTDYYDGQPWKNYPGASRVVLWCVQHLETQAYETLWPLLIPPLMTLLDDYEVRYKLRGVQIVFEMLQAVPREILKRTGVDVLFQTSLKNCLAHLQSPETPELFRITVQTQVSLILLTTSAGTGERFDQLSVLLGEGVVQGAWLYASDNVEVMQATFEALPAIVQALGIGTCRYLKPLVTQLTHVLVPSPLNRPPQGLQVASLRVLMAVIDVCRLRMDQWSNVIFNGLGKCWVALMDSGSEDSNITGDTSELAMALRHTCERLADACPSIIQEYERALAAEPQLFRGLFDGAGLDS